MNVRKITVGIFAGLGMLVFVLDGQTALLGAQEGVVLCLRTVVPSLFPFLFLSGLFMDAVSGETIPGLKLLGKFFSIPAGMEGLWIAGFLGGYPVGAQSIGVLYRNHHLNRQEAQRLLRYCSNAGPAFLFGMASSLFPEKWMPWAIWSIQIGSAWIVSTLSPMEQQTNAPNFQLDSGKDSALNSAVTVMLRICGWVVLFRVLLTFLRRWVLWIFPTEVQVVVAGLLDLTNGCLELSRIHSIPVRFVLCCGMLAWGGLCVTMQTASVTEGLSLSAYMMGKVLQTVLSVLLSVGIMYQIWTLFYGLAGIIWIMQWKKRKKSRNLIPIGV